MGRPPARRAHAGSRLARSLGRARARRAARAGPRRHRPIADGLGPSRAGQRVLRSPCEPINVAPSWRCSSRRTGEARLILTRRSAALRSHRGEVSFPGGPHRPGGGRPDGGPAGGLRGDRPRPGPGRRRRAGSTRVVTVASGSLIIPIVASRRRGPHVVASPAEVERVFDVAAARPGRPRDLPRGALAVPGGRSPAGRDGSFPSGSSRWRAK